MSKKKTNNVKSNYQHFKATIGTINEELDYFGNLKEVLSLDKEIGRASCRERV